MKCLTLQPETILNAIKLLWMQSLPAWEQALAPRYKAAMAVEGRMTQTSRENRSLNERNKALRVKNKASFNFI